MLTVPSLSLGLSLSLTFFAGLVSFASPCVLPLVPSYLGFLAAETGKFRGFIRTLGFVLGFVIVFALLGLFFTQGSQMIGSQNRWIQYASGGIVILFALNLWFNFLPFLNYELKAHFTRRPAGFLEAVVVGMAFGAGWTPCIGPILSTILFYAAVSGNTINGLGYLVFYGLGLGVPFLLLSLGLDTFRPALNWMKARARQVQIGSGILLMAFGLLIITGQTLVFSSWLPSAGYRLERWNASNPSLGQTIGILFPTLLLVLPGIILLFARYQKLRKLSVPGAIMLILYLVILWGDLSGQWDVLKVAAAWMQFQGI